MNLFLKILWNIYYYSILVLGHISLFILIWILIRSIIMKFHMKSSAKKYIKALKNSKFLDKTFEKKTDDEKDNKQKKVSINPQTMEVKETIMSNKEGK